MRIRVLGSAAGGGFPQWNCACSLCARARAGDANVQARTQSSIAVQGDGSAAWLLVNASPDLRAQMAANGLTPQHGVRHTPIAAVLLMDGQIDHAAGLLLMRELGRPMIIYTTPEVREDLSAGYPLLTMLGHYCGVDARLVSLTGDAFSIAETPGFRCSPVPVAGKPAPYSPHRGNPRVGDNLGLTFIAAGSGKKVFYAPGLGTITPAVRAAMEQADVLMVDGTCWHDDDLARNGISPTRARDMGHLPQAGAGGMLEVLAAFPRARKILIHINNTNPILDACSPERAQLTALGIEVAHDGMEIAL
jgi:pyrroloquinoline quinone biosynthesis protein B